MITRKSGKKYNKNCSCDRRCTLFKWGVAKLKQIINADDFSPAVEDKLSVIKMTVHLVDISNPV